VRNPCLTEPVINDLLHPIWHRNCADMASFPHQVHDGPMIFPALNVVQSQIDQLSSTKTATEKHCQHGAIPFAFNAVHVWKLL